MLMLIKSDAFTKERRLQLMLFRRGHDDDLGECKGHSASINVPVLLELGEPLWRRIGFVAVVFEPGVAGIDTWPGRKIVSDQFHGNAQFFCEAQIIAVQNPVGCHLHAGVQWHGTAMKWHHLGDRIPFATPVHEYLFGIGKVNQVHNAITLEVSHAHTLNKVGVANGFARGLLLPNTRRLGTSCQHQHHGQ